jgi:hypothetical protein
MNPRTTAGAHPRLLDGIAAEGARSSRVARDTGGAHGATTKRRIRRTRGRWHTRCFKRLPESPELGRWAAEMRAAAETTDGQGCTADPTQSTEPPVLDQLRARLVRASARSFARDARAAPARRHRRRPHRRLQRAASRRTLDAERSAARARRMQRAAS